MADNELVFKGEVGTSSLLPITGKLSLELRRGWDRRGLDVVDRILSLLGEGQLATRVAESEEFEALIGRAVTIGAATSLERSGHC